MIIDDDDDEQRQSLNRILDLPGLTYFIATDFFTFPIK